MKMKAKAGFFKSLLFFFLALLGGHLAESLIYGVALNTIVGNVWRDGYESNAVGIITAYGIIIHVVFCIVYTVVTTRSVTYRDSFKAEIKNGCSAGAIFKKFYIKHLSYEIPVYFAVLLPFTIYFAFIKNVDLANSFAFEKFYIAELWIYVITKNALLGIIISSLIFFIVLFAVRFIVTAVTRKNLIENSVTLS